MGRVADKGYCKRAADRLNISPIAAEEAFLGEDTEECNRIIRWIEQEEVDMRARYGWSYVFKNFKPRMLLRSWARKNKKGAFRG